MKFVPIFGERLLISTTFLSSLGEYNNYILPYLFISSRTTKTKVTMNSLKIINLRRGFNITLI